jgi:sensor histidine kinase regulating citrate/malate metabolism
MNKLDAVDLFGHLEALEGTIDIMIKNLKKATRGVTPEEIEQSVARLEAAMTAVHEVVIAQVREAGVVPLCLNGDDCKCQRFAKK